MITKFEAENFTAFKKVGLNVSEGINIFIGENGTGKTHIMKAIYAACCVLDKKQNQNLAQKVQSLFLPDSIGRLVKRAVGRSSGSFKVFRTDDDGISRWIRLKLSTLGKEEITNQNWSLDQRYASVFIPVKDMLANAPGFRSLYASKNIHFEEIYSDIIDRALLPIPRGKPAKERKELLGILKRSVSGEVVVENEEFYLKDDQQGKLEFTLLAEGYRKLGLLYTLIQNETLTKGSVLFWDEPEANLNPKLARIVVEILVKLQQMGVQIFVATHDYVLLKEFDLAISTENKVLYHALYRTKEEEIDCNSVASLSKLEPNAIDDAYLTLLDRDIQRDLSKQVK